MNEELGKQSPLPIERGTMRGTWGLNKKKTRQARENEMSIEGDQPGQKEKRKKKGGKKNVVKGNWKG